VGTMDYIAPEQIRAPDDVGPSADIYALGCTLYYAVTGRVPFPGGSRKEKMQRHLTEAPDPIRRLAPQLSEAFCRVIDDMMAKAPDQRVPSANAVVERLRPWLPDGQTWNGRGLAVAELLAARGREGLRPPPLPRLTGASDRSSASSLSGVSDFSLGPPPDPSESFSAATSLRWAWVARLLMKPFLFALAGGLGFGIALRLTRSLAPDRFDALLGGTAPVTLGCVAFLLLFVLQAAATAAGQRR
jgi:serine/threonine protein kinase